jgi:hypothetical protein
MPGISLKDHEAGTTLEPKAAPDAEPDLVRLDAAMLLMLGLAAATKPGNKCVEAHNASHILSDNVVFRCPETGVCYRYSIGDHNGERYIMREVNCFGRRGESSKEFYIVNYESLSRGLYCETDPVLTHKALL